MIESVLVGVPKDTVPRGTTEDVIKFERVTGIKVTRRTKMNTYNMICSLIDQMPRILDVPDHLIVITQSPDQLSPCMAAEIHDYLDLPSSVISFDINHACDGWVFGVNLANKLGGRTMLICADRLRYAPNPIEALMFSDSATITMITAGMNPFKSFTDGSKSKCLYAGLDGTMEMRGGDVFDFVTSKMPGFIDSFMRGYDYLVPHQANLSMLKLIEMRTEYKGKTLYSIEEYGNQSMNSIPTCIAHNESKVLGKQLLAVGFGAGFTAAGIGIHWPKTPITRIVEI